MKVYALKVKFKFKRESFILHSSFIQCKERKKMLFQLQVHLRKEEHNNNIIHFVFSQGCFTWPFAQAKANNSDRFSLLIIFTSFESVQATKVKKGTENSIYLQHSRTCRTHKRSNRNINISRSSLITVKTLFVNGLSHYLT